MLTQRLGFGATAEVMFTARIFDADEARQFGVLQRVFASANFESDLADYIEMIAVNAPLSLKAAKRALIELEKLEAEQNRAAALDAVAACYNSSDYKEGQAAFKEKRLPVFTGK